MGSKNRGGLSRSARNAAYLGNRRGDAADGAIKPTRVLSKPPKENSYHEESWTLQPWSAFKILLSVRLCSALWSNISDCDETFNYWEPTHYLIYGTGLQTWEYSPAYAIRSYAYLWLYGLPALLHKNLAQPKKVFVFFVLRCLLALFSSLCELYFYRGVIKQFGPRVARLTLCFLILGTGMFVAATAFLPSTFSMHLLLLAYGSWLQNHYKVSILTSGINAILGWPFAGLLSLPIAVDIVLLKRRGAFFLKYALIFGLAICGPVIAIDTYYYGKLTFASLNIIAYNVLSKHGANLYGTEPLHFYLVNGFLNWNIVFFASIAVIPVALLSKIAALLIGRGGIKFGSSHWLCISGLFLWFLVFFSQAHKEERFLFPVYPFVCLCAAFSLELVRQFITAYLPSLSKLYNFSLMTFIGVFCLLSISRSIVLSKGYHASMDIYMDIEKMNEEIEKDPSAYGNQINLCVGKEWHRFPSSFFLPNSKWHLQFVKSNFAGQLPKPFSTEPLATRLYPDAMNDLNREETSRYIDASECHFMVDSDYPEYGLHDLPYSQDADNWEIVTSLKFLDANKSPPLWRAFYVPFIHERKCSYVNYNLLKRRRR